MHLGVRCASRTPELVRAFSKQPITRICRFAVQTTDAEQQTIVVYSSSQTRVTYFKKTTTIGRGLYA